MVVRMTVGLVLTVIALAIAGRRLWRLAMSGQPAPERVAAVREHPGRDAETQAAEVIGQRKLLKWSVPGVAHALTFWGLIVLLLTIIEAYGALFSRTLAIPGIGHLAFIGFITAASVVSRRGNQALTAADGADRGRRIIETIRHEE
jgi:hypothetical protein